MRYLPARCEACSGVTLVLEAICSFGETFCPECQAPASVLPGCSYSADDLPLFQELRGLLQRAELSATEAGEIVLILDSLSSTSDDRQTFSHLVDHVPSLAPAQVVLASHPAKLRQALTLLSTLIHELAFARASGTVNLRQARAVHQV